MAHSLRCCRKFLWIFLLLVAAPAAAQKMVSVSTEEANLRAGLPMAGKLFRQDLWRSEIAAVDGQRIDKVLVAPERV